MFKALDTPVSRVFFLIEMVVNMENVAHFEKFIPVLKTRELPGQLWQLQEPLRFFSVVFNKWFEVPAGFITDGNSDPPIIFWLHHIADEAAYLHDWNYSAHWISREDSDILLRECVIAQGYGELEAEQMFLGVRAFGGSHWNLPNVPQPSYVDAIMNAGNPIDKIYR